MAQDEADGIRNGAIALPPRVDIGSAGALRDAILAHEGDIVLDARAVTVVTSPGFQVLMACRDRQARAGCGMRLANATPAFSSCAATLGIRPERLTCAGAAS